MIEDPIAQKEPREPFLTTLLLVGLTVLGFVMGFLCGAIYIQALLFPD